MRGSTLSFPEEYGFETSISEESNIQIHVHGPAESQTSSTNFPDSLISEYKIVSGDHY